MGIYRLTLFTAFDVAAARSPVSAQLAKARVLDVPGKPLVVLRHRARSDPSASRGAK
jgi:hypothetical protein